MRSSEKTSTQLQSEAKNYQTTRDLSWLWDQLDAVKQPGQSKTSTNQHSLLHTWMDSDASEQNTNQSSSTTCHSNTYQEKHKFTSQIESETDKYTAAMVLHQSQQESKKYSQPMWRFSDQSQKLKDGSTISESQTSEFSQSPILFQLQQSKKNKIY
ncbi:MAG: hypothetical protein [Aguamentivirus racskinis]|uniref:Uncharacterized protein n=1 Tax=Circoviridae sp. TaxID=1954248 RepID=A0A3G2YTU6_9VIRU|nr:MAG: hypothetical protein [Circoviridae sp.]